MRCKLPSVFAAIVVTCGVLSIPIGFATAPAADQSKTANDKTVAGNKVPASRPVSLKEARGQAKLLHETIHATLQIVHRQYFREDEGIAIPSRTMKKVFRELKRSCGVDVHWLVVNAKAMDVDHSPRDAFEKKAAAAIASGQQEFEGIEDGTYRYVGAITLSNMCLKCHLPNRTSTKARAAGLVISMAVKKK